MGFPPLQVRASSPDVRLVVVVVIDQFRYEYLHRFREHFVEDGFNRLLQQGANFTNAKYLHGTSDTCPGHAVIATGTWADVNGIIGNAWFDTESRSGTGCVSPGAPNPAGNLLRPTIGDLLKNASSGSNKVITASGKSSAAILLGGQLADSTYWPGEQGRFRDSAGNDSKLPEWVRSFNDSGRVEAYYRRPWEKSLTDDAYAQPEPAEGFAAQSKYSDVRERIHELTGGILEIDPGFYKAFEESPYQDEVLADFVIAAIREEGLGQHDHADLLAVSFSSSDRVGHTYGPYSHEIQDTVVRLDRQLARLFAFIDQEVGMNRTLLVLTADHGAAPVPESAEANMGVKIAARIEGDQIVNAAADALHAAYGDPDSGDWVVFHDFPNLYLNEEAFRSMGLQISDAERTAKRAIEKVEGIKAAYTHSELAELSRSEDVRESIRPLLLSFYPQRSGNIVYQVMPFRVVSEKGTNHGSHWLYDTHVPLLWLGPKVKPGNYADTASPADIAPTLMTMLGIEHFPRFSGRVLHEMLTGQTAQSPQ